MTTNINFDNWSTYGEIQICDTCYSTDPCQHYVKINENNQTLLTGDNIYKLFINQNLQPPDHFKYYKYKVDIDYFSQKIINNEFDEFKNNYFFTHNTYSEKAKDCFLRIACNQNNMKFIKYLVEDKKTPVSCEILKNCAKNIDQLELTKYFLSKDFHLQNINLLNVAAYHQNFLLVKYLIEELKVPLDRSTLIMSLTNNKPDNAIVTYLLGKSIEENIIYDSFYDIECLIKHNLIDTCLKNKMVNQFFKTAKVIIQLNHSHNKKDTPEEIIDREIETLLTNKAYENYLDPLKYTNLQKFNTVKIPMFKTKLLLQKIQIIPSADHDFIDNIKINLGESSKLFKKTNENIYEFSFLQPLYYWYAVYSISEIEIHTKNNKIITGDEFNVVFTFGYSFTFSKLQHHVDDHLFSQVDDTTCVEQVAGLMQFKSI